MAQLSPRELEILVLVCSDKSSREIAEELCISAATVDTHRKALLRKTGSKNKIGLVKFALRNRLIG
ncbi:MAG TPA: LuxR C-terminal-related transcriptional regulator [Bacteroidia bacterium]|nr:LuxR C-terminal-related transcriptional regulator [Bacteroidia bacterium]